MRSSVREAGPDDLPAIVRLYLEVAEEVVAREPDLRQVPVGSAVERRYRSRIENADRAVLVADTDGAVIGFIDASVWRSEDEGTFSRPGVHVHIEELVVTRSHRRRGTATGLLRAIEAWGRSLGARMVWVDTHLSNEIARTLYARTGFEEFGVVLKKKL